MHMWYWFGTDLGDFLFPGCNVTTTWRFVSTCLGLSALALLYEGMRIMQIRMHRVTIIPKPETSTSSENSSLLSKMSPQYLTSTHCVSWYKWIIQVFLWSVHTMLGYILMMAVMTYNAYISIAVIIGGCFGYWIFGPTLVRLNMARILQMQTIMQCDKDCADVNVNRERRESTVSIVAEQLLTEATVEVHAPNNN